MEQQPGEDLEKAFEKMEEEGVPKNPAPREEVVEQKKDVEEKLPKLSAQEFRLYNSMAEHMDMFVRTRTGEVCGMIWG